MRSSTRAPRRARSTSFSETAAPFFLSAFERSRSPQIWQSNAQALR